MPPRKRSSKRKSKVLKQKQQFVKGPANAPNSQPSSEPELPSKKPLNACRYENCKTCKQTSTNTDNLFDSIQNDCGKTNNNEEKVDLMSWENIRINQTYKGQIINQETETIKIDTSIYDYKDEYEPNNGETLETSKDDERTCILCKTTFENPLDLLRHKRNYHKFPKTMLTLEQIERFFDYPNRNFCPICKKSIKTMNFRSVFIKHLKTHTWGATYECRICKRVFKRKDHMKAHESRHIIQS